MGLIFEMLGWYMQPTSKKCGSTLNTPDVKGILKHCGKKEKMLVSNFFYFSPNILKFCKDKSNYSGLIEFDFLLCRSVNMDYFAILSF